MKLEELKKLIDKLYECDSAMRHFDSPSCGYGQGMRQAIQGGIIERKTNLLEKINREFGVDVEV